MSSWYRKRIGVSISATAAPVAALSAPYCVYETAVASGVLAVAAALLVTPTYLAKFDMGEGLGTKAFFAAIIGGFNNSRGALLQEGAECASERGLRLRTHELIRTRGSR